MKQQGIVRGQRVAANKLAAAKQLRRVSDLTPNPFPKGKGNRLGVGVSR